MPKGPAPAYNVAAGHDPLGQPPGERFSGGSRGRYRITVLCAWATGTPFPTGPPWWWGGDLAGRHSAPWEAGPLPVNARAWGSLHSAVFRDRACPPLLTDQVVSSSHEIPSPSPAVAEEEEEEEESLFKADAVNEEDPERDRATQV